MNRLLAALCLAAAARAQPSFPLKLASPAEVVADLALSSPGSDWATAGREGALADVVLDGRVQQQVMLYAGAARHTYAVFIGRLETGAHRLQVLRNESYSAQGSGLEVHGVKFREVRAGHPYYAVLSHAPVLYARADTIGGFTDVPMVVYCQRPQEEGKPQLEYTVIFSNEDGGTSTRGLMARWGRTTDIEYIYRGFIDTRGAMPKATIQTKDHKDVDFDGKYFGSHPILAPITDNNMVGTNVETPIRYQIAPVEVDLTDATRESVMDSHPVAWTVMAKELAREGKLRPFGKVDHERISDPRNYLYLDVRPELEDATIDFLVRLKGERLWRSSSAGRPDYTIGRSEWVRTSIELPPGTKIGQIEEFGFACHTAIVQKPFPQPSGGVCRLADALGVFLLDAGYRPGPRMPLKAGFEVPTGILWTSPSK